LPDAGFDFAALLAKSAPRVRRRDIFLFLRRRGIIPLIAGKPETVDMGREGGYT
jgi:hypothetical protein